jgi:uncharacterized phage protein gp47/JayE
MAILTFADIVNDMINYIKLKRPDADTLEGTVLRDIVIEAVSQEIANAYTEISTLEKAQSVNYANDLTIQQMDDLAANFDLTRKAATYSTGFVTFSAFTQPNSDIQIGSGDGSGGVIVTTRTLDDGSVVQFVTTQTVFLRSTAVQDPTYGTYDVTAPIVAMFAGISGNVGSNNIVVIQQPIPGINTATNRLATSGGTDLESNSALAQRIIAKAQARNLDTKAGYRSLVISQPGILDASVVGPNDPEAVRNQFGNEVDIYLLGTNPAQAQQVTTFYNGTLEYLIDNRPVTSVIGVIGLSNAVPFTFSQGVDYNLSLDITTPYAKSVLASDKLAWSVLGAKPDAGSLFTIAYVYDKNVPDTQNLLELEDNRVLTADVLAKEAIEVFIDIGFTATATGGYDKTTVQTQIIAALTTIINTGGLGARVEQSDLVYQIRNTVQGISSIILPFTTLARRGSSGSNQYLQAQLTEYFRLDNNSLTGIVVS